jgi:hypothetical protein
MVNTSVELHQHFLLEHNEGCVAVSACSIEAEVALDIPLTKERKKKRNIKKI